MAKGEKPKDGLFGSVSYFSLSNEFTKLRSETPWLQELPSKPVRYTLKYQADAWKRAFKHGGFPRFKARWGDDSVTLPQDVRIRGNKLLVPRLGWY